VVQFSNTDCEYPLPPKATKRKARVWVSSVKLHAASVGKVVFVGRCRYVRRLRHATRYALKIPLGVRREENTIIVFPSPVPQLRSAIFTHWGDPDRGAAPWHGGTRQVAPKVVCAARHKTILQATAVWGIQ